MPCFACDVELIVVCHVIILTKNKAGEGESVENGVEDSDSRFRSCGFCIDLLLIGIRVCSHCDEGKFVYYCIVFHCEKPVNRLRNGLLDNLKKVVEFFSYLRKLVYSSTKNTFDYIGQYSERDKGPDDFDECGLILLPVKAKDKGQSNCSDHIFDNCHPLYGLI